MHFEILVEDASGKMALEQILEKIVGPSGDEHTFRIIPYKGIGRIPKNLKANSDPKHRALLNRLPHILGGYGKAHKHIEAVVIVVVDLDSKNCLDFKQELMDILDSCDPAPTALFRIAIEEGEAWLLGDRKAVETAYPNVKKAVLKKYKQDSICGTWEVLADALYKGGATKLKKLGWPAAGEAKCEWAEKIAPYMDVDKNKSKSFQTFRDGVRRFLSSSS